MYLNVAYVKKMPVKVPIKNFYLVVNCAEKTNAKHVKSSILQKKYSKVLTIHPAKKYVDNFITVFLIYCPNLCKNIIR